jgi:hypothetical protein
MRFKTFAQLIAKKFNGTAIAHQGYVSQGRIFGPLGVTVDMGDGRHLYYSTIAQAAEAFGL